MNHAALQVADPEASVRWYLDVLGLEATVRPEGDGLVLTDDRGVKLALLGGDPLPAEVIGRIHIGCEVASPEEVHAARDRLAARGVREVEWCEEPDYVSVKVADPDGYVVELFWESV